MGCGAWNIPASQRKLIYASIVAIPVAPVVFFGRKRARWEPLATGVGACHGSGRSSSVINTLFASGT